MRAKRLFRSKCYVVKEANKSISSSSEDTSCCFPLPHASTAKHKQENLLLRSNERDTSTTSQDNPLLSATEECLETSLDKHELQKDAFTISQENPIAARRARRRRKNRVILLVGAVGGIFFALASLIHILNPVAMIIKSRLALSEGSNLFHLWHKPPIPFYIKIYVFNVTNPDAFLAGTEKLRLEELGPFIYTETTEHSDPVFNKNNTITYKPKREIVYESGLSINMSLDTRIIVPNIPLIGLSSMLAGSSMFTNLAFTTVTNYLNSQSFLNLSIEEFLWGYDDPIVALGSRFAPSWISFSKFGVVERMFAEGENVETMNTNDEPKPNVQPFTIDNINGCPGLKHWGYDVDDSTTHKTCNTLRGIAIDGIIFMRNLTPADSFLVYRKPFCRTMPLIYDRSNVTETGLPTYWMKLPPGAFDNTNPENSCYCQPDKGPCLPRGLSDITPCYYGIPAALSQPHFFNADPRLLEAVDGLVPDVQKHDSVFIIQPDLGMPLELHFRIQTNLIVKNTKYNKRSAPFNNLTVPLFWFETAMHEVPNYLASLVYLLIFVAPAVQHGSIFIFALLGVSMVMLSAAAYASGKRRESERERARLLWNRL